MAGEQELPFLKSGVAQIALVVKDLEETVRQYYEQFGIAPWHFYTYQKPLVKRMSYRGGRLSTASGWLCLTWAPPASS